MLGSRRYFRTAHLSVRPSGEKWRHYRCARRTASGAPWSCGVCYLHGKTAASAYLRRTGIDAKMLERALASAALAAVHSLPS